jgi:glucosamine--fructose-6-phosphate aminotransferase (isomerizing)
VDPQLARHDRSQDADRDGAAAVHGAPNGYVPYAVARARQADAIEAAIPRLRDQVAALRAAGWLAGPGPVFSGIGASLAAACGPVWTLRARGIDAVRLGAGDHPVPYPASAAPVIAVSQSGRSTETLDVLRSVARGRRLAVTNARPSPIADVVGAGITLGDVPDSYASTIGYTATVAALGLLADAWDGAAEDPAWRTLADHIRAMEDEASLRAAELAPMIDASTTVDLVAAGPAIGTAEAGALLVREALRIPATGMGTRQYLHGSMESAGRSVHVLLGDGRELEVARTLAASGHPVILVTSAARAAGVGFGTIEVPDLSPAPRAILEIVAIQALVAEVAGRRGIDIDAFVFDNPDTKVTAD